MIYPGLPMTDDAFLTMYEACVMTPADTGKQLILADRLREVADERREPWHDELADLVEAKCHEFTTAFILPSPNMVENRMGHHPRLGTRRGLDWSQGDGAMYRAECDLAVWEKRHCDACKGTGKKQVRIERSNYLIPCGSCRRGRVPGKLALVSAFLVSEVRVLVPTVYWMASPEPPPDHVSVVGPQLVNVLREAAGWYAAEANNG